MPLVPTTPFIVLAAVCFGKSSVRLHTWCINTRFYKNNVENFVKRRTMKIKAKIILLSSVTLFMCLSYILLTIFDAPVAVKIVLAFVWLCHVVYFGIVVKTLK